MEHSVHSGRLLIALTVVGLLLTGLFAALFLFEEYFAFAPLELSPLVSSVQSNTSSSELIVASIFWSTLALFVGILFAGTFLRTGTLVGDSVFALSLGALITLAASIFALTPWANVPLAFQSIAMHTYAFAALVIFLFIMFLCMLLSQIIMSASR